MSSDDATASDKPIPPRGGEDEPIRLVEPEGPTKHGQEPDGIRTFGVHAAGAAFGLEKAKTYHRPVNVNGTGATRCRLFHSKIAAVPLENLQAQINDWLDSEKVEIKHVGHIIGTMEGKRPEPNLLVMVWY